MSEEPIEKETEQKSKQQEGSAIGETLSVVVQALILAVILRTLLFQPFSIPSGSMKDTLLVGDYLFVSKFSYGYSKYSLPFAPDLFDGRIWSGEPERGDIAVFRPPNTPQIDYIKRVIGLPGDKIQMIDSVLHINGVAVKREKAGLFADDQTGKFVQSYIETLPNGVTYNTLDLNYSSTDDTRVFEVPEGHYFMMGDNRDNSTDSRYPSVGAIPLENFVGKAQVVFFSIRNQKHPLAVWEWPENLRFDRIFTGL